MRHVIVIAATMMLIAATVRVAAQDRMPPIPGDKLTDAQKSAIEAFKAARKLVIDTFAELSS